MRGSIRTVLLFSLLLLSGTSISAQSLRDSISFEITSFIDKDNVGHYTDIRLELKNHTKNFKYLLVPLGLDMYLVRRYWQAVVEVEYRDKTRRQVMITPVFDLGKIRYLLPGEHLVKTRSFSSIASLIKSYNQKGADIVRFRLYTDSSVVRHNNNGDPNSWYVYEKPDIATDWVDITTPEFDFLRE